MPSPYGNTKPFEKGKKYLTQEGKEVICIEVNDHKYYESARFNDGDGNGLTWSFTGGYYHRHTHEWIPVVWRTHTTGWRYNRDSDRGRVTGSAHDFSDPRNVIPESAD